MRERVIIGGGGAFRTLSLSEHARTQIDTIRHFLDTAIDVRQDARGTVTVSVDPLS